MNPSGKTDLYREELMEHYKDPQNRGHLENPSVSVYDKNPFCGDDITLQLNVDAGIITDIAFDGEACAVSIAASSMLTDEIKGKTLEEAKAFTKDTLLEMLGVELTTSRIKCATLVLDALKKAIEGYEKRLQEKDLNTEISFKDVKVDLPVTKDTNLGMLVAAEPNAAEVLLDYGLHCVGCIASTYDSVEEGARIHGYSDEEIQEMVDRINEVIEHGE